MKTVKSRLFKKYLKKKIASKFSFSWLATYQWKKIIENCNSVGAGAPKVEKVVSFEPTVDSSFPIFGDSEKSKLYLLKKVGLATFKEIWYVYVIALSCF